MMRMWRDVAMFVLIDVMSLAFFSWLAWGNRADDALLLMDCAFLTMALRSVGTTVTMFRLALRVHRLNRAATTMKGRSKE